MHILITRPEPDASEWRALLEARGATVSVDPLLDIEFLAPATLELGGVQGLIATSRNGLRGLRDGRSLEGAKALPMFVVGPGTAELAKDLGFSNIHDGPASARDLVPLIAGLADPLGGRLVHACGDKLAFDLAAALAPLGFMIERLTVYRSRPATSLQGATIAGLATGAIDTVVLMSPLTAKTFAKLAVEAHLMEQCQRVVYICLSDKVAGALAPLSPVATLIAPKPNSDAIFTLIETLVDETP